MTLNFFADSDFLTGLMVDNDSRSSKSKDIFAYLLNNELIANMNDFHISNYIVMEVVNNLQGKHVSFRQTKENYDKLMRCHVFHIRPKNIDEAISTKLAPYCNHRSNNPPIGIVDATSLIVMDKMRINYLISFDEGFDKLPDKFLNRVMDNSVIDRKILSRFR